MLFKWCRPFEHYFKTIFIAHLLGRPKTMKTSESHFVRVRLFAPHTGNCCLGPSTALKLQTTCGTGLWVREVVTLQITTQLDRIVSLWGCDFANHKLTNSQPCLAGLWFAKSQTHELTTLSHRAATCKVATPQPRNPVTVCHRVVLGEVAGPSTHRPVWQTLCLWHLN